jgi:flagellar basal body-associated protein FliL
MNLSPKSKKIIIFSAAVLLVAIAVTSSLAYFTYSASLKKEVSYSVPSFTLKPAEKIKLGDIVLAETTVTCPWGHYPVKVEFTPEEGIQQPEDPKIIRAKTKWGENVWKIVLSLQPYRTGKIKEERAVIIFSSDAENPVEHRIAATVPPFNVLAVETGKDSVLDLASSVKHPKIEKKSTWIIITVAALIFIAALVILYLIYRKHKDISEKRVVPPWEAAVESLRNLKEQINNHKINHHAAVAMLTDIVRRYLEKRYNITVTAKTTYEFLLDLDKGGSPLNVEHKNFLREFLTAADFVKFAKVPPDDNMINTAIEKAEELVTSTIPEENEEQQSSSKGV